MKSSNDKTIGEVIRELVETYHLEGKLNEMKVVQSWEKVVGKMIARFTKDIYMKRGKLFVRIDSPALKNELSYNTTMIIERLNNEAGCKVVDDIIFI